MAFRQTYSRLELTIIMVSIIAIIAGFLFYQTPDSQGVVKAAAEDAGLRFVTVKKPAFTRCDENDIYGYFVSGVNSQNKDVKAIVCCDIFQYCTIKY